MNRSDAGSGPRTGAAVPLALWEGRPVREWQRLWDIPRLEVYAGLPSTNDRARRLAEEGAAPFSAVLAEEQTAGRGRSGRVWLSPPGCGLWISFVVRGGGEGPGVVPLLAGLAAVRAVEASVPGLRAELKWPNDVLLGGRKACGILCEGVGADALVVGIGLNVHQRPRDFPPEFRDAATSVSEAAGAPVPRAPLAGALARELRQLVTDPPRRLDGPLAREVEARDALRGRSVVTSGGLQGTGRGVDARGALLVEVEPGRVERILAGTVRLLAAPTGTTPPPDGGG